MKLTAAVGLLGIVLGTIVGIGAREALASPLQVRVQGGPTQGGPQGERHLQLVARGIEARTVDLGSQGHSHGDMRIYSATLFDAASGRRMGESHGVCLITDPANQAGESLHFTQCTLTAILPGGQITAQYARGRPHIGSRSVSNNWAAAITGGTGIYETVRGQIISRPRGRDLHLTFDVHQ